MIEKIYDINGVYELFRSYNGLGNDNCIFYMVTENSIDFKTIAKGVVFGVALNAVGGSVIDVQQTKNINNTSHFSGYLVNQTEYGIGLIPLQTEKPTDAINDMKIVPNSYIFIEQKNIKNIKIEQKIMYSLDSSIRIVTFEFVNGQKEIFRVYDKDKYVKYQESNFIKFMNHYSYSNNKTKLINKVFSVLLKIVIIAIFVVPIIAVIVALNSSNKGNTTSINNGSTVDTSKIKVDMYNP